MCLKDSGVEVYLEEYFKRLEQVLFQVKPGTLTVNLSE